MTILNRPDAQVLFDRMSQLFSSNVLGGAPIIPESNEFYVVSNDYAVAEQFYSIAEQQWRERDPRYACCDNLIAMAADDGVYPYAASFSQGYALLVGVADAVLPSNIAIKYQEETYNVVSAIPAVMPSTGELVIRVEAATPGPGFNSSVTGATASLIVPITDVENDVAIYGSGFCGGADAEACEEFRTRYLDRKRYKPLARLDWIMNKVAEWPCVTRVCLRAGACCDQGDDGCGCTTCGTLLELYPIMEGTFECGLPPQCVVDEISDWIFGEEQGIGTGQVEYGVCGQLYSAEAAVVDIAISGTACLNATQLDAIRLGIEDLFNLQCPSQTLCKKQIETIAAQITGTPCEIEIGLSTDSDKVDINECDDLEPHCDVQLCLGSVTFEAESSTYLGDC